MIAVDFTRTAESVAKTGADLTKWAKQQETKVCLDKCVLITQTIESHCNFPVFFFYFSG